MVISRSDISVIRLFKVFPKGGNNRLCKVYDDKKKLSLSRVSPLSVGIPSFLSASNIFPLYNCYFTGPERLCSQNRVHHHPHCLCHGYQHYQLLHHYHHYHQHPWHYHDQHHHQHCHHHRHHHHHHLQHHLQHHHKVKSLYLSTLVSVYLIFLTILLQWAVFISCIAFSSSEVR